MSGLRDTSVRMEEIFHSVNISCGFLEIVTIPKVKFCTVLLSDYINYELPETKRNSTNLKGLRTGNVIDSGVTISVHTKGPLRTIHGMAGF